MNNNLKKMIKWQLKDWLPFLIISSVLVSIIFWLYCSTETTVVTVYDYSSYGGDIHYMYPSDIYFTIAVFFLPLTFILPFAIFGYRYSTKKADTFFQLPLKENVLKRFKFLTLLIFYLGVFTLAYWIGVLILGMNQIFSNNHLADNQMGFWFNYWYFIPIYLFLLVVLAIEFTLNSFFISLANTAWGSIFHMVIGNLILLLSGYSLFDALTVLTNDSAIYNIALSFPSLSFVEPFFIGVNVLEKCLLGNQVTSLEPIRYVSFSLHVLIGGGAFLYLWFGKEPSGEYAGKYKPFTTISAIMPHVLAVILGLFLSQFAYITIFQSALLYVQFAMYAIMALGGYYFLIVLFKMSFNWEKKTWIAMIACVLFVAIIVGLSFGLQLSRYSDVIDY